jgi:hypothetical protein
MKAINLAGWARISQKGVMYIIIKANKKKTVNHDLLSSPVY